MVRRTIRVATLATICLLSTPHQSWGQPLVTSLPNLFPLPNATGLLETFSAGGKPIDLTGPFFQSLGPTDADASPATALPRVGAFPLWK